MEKHDLLVLNELTESGSNLRPSIQVEHALAEIKDSYQTPPLAKIPFTEIAALGGSFAGVVETMATPAAEGLYRCVFPKGVTGTLAMAKDGSGALGTIMNDGIVGQARWIPVDKAIGPACFKAALVAVAVLAVVKKFAVLLYRWHNDYFREFSKVSDVSSYVKGSIYEYIEGSEKAVVVVDCENSDPYKLCAVLKNLDYQYTQKISSIILFDDVHTASAWRILEDFTKIPVEHILIERVKESKSLVDIKLTARACQEHYINKVDSFIIVSSDSDYWGLISSLPDARFLMMIEHEKSGPDLKAALVNTGIFYCYIDDFYSGNAEELKFGALIKEMYRYIDSTVHLNVNDMFTAALKATRIEMSEAEKKQFMAQHIKTMQMSIAPDGEVVLSFKHK